MHLVEHVYEIIQGCRSTKHKIVLSQLKFWSLFTVSATLYCDNEQGSNHLLQPDRQYRSLFHINTRRSCRRKMADVLKENGGCFEEGEAILYRLITENRRRLNSNPRSNI